eukprot:scaffold41935_cov75-Phaeocystis_antarctica.AAC.4
MQRLTSEEAEAPRHLTHGSAAARAPLAQMKLPACKLPRKSWTMFPWHCCCIVPPLQPCDRASLVERTGAGLREIERR